MCLMMCREKSKFQDESIKFEKNNDGSCETRGNVIFEMSLCDILKNHPFSIPIRSNKSQSTQSVPFCVGKNPIWMEEPQFFQKNQLCACEAPRSPILAPFFTVFQESSATGHSMTRFSLNPTTCLLSNAKKISLDGWPPKFRKN